MGLYPTVGSRRVLVVDDDRDVADSLVLLLRCWGLDVHVAYSGEAALTAVTELRPDLALMDIGMPGMDGCETARRMRKLPEARDLVIAAVSAWGPEDIRRGAAEAQFDHHFVKPIKIEVLEEFLGVAA
jgi:CheY-like chemotaxis protein